MSIYITDSDNLISNNELIKVYNKRNKIDPIELGSKEKVLSYDVFKTNTLGELNIDPMSKIAASSSIFEEKNVHRKYLLNLEQNNFEGTTVINSWKLTHIFKARLISKNEYSNTLEVLIDEDVVDEREFDSHYFDGIDLDVYQYFQIRIYQRPNEERMQLVWEGITITRDDFPKIDMENITNDDIFTI